MAPSNVFVTRIKGEIPVTRLVCLCVFRYSSSASTSGTDTSSQLEGNTDSSNLNSSGTQADPASGSTMRSHGLERVLRRVEYSSAWQCFFLFFLEGKPSSSASDLLR